MKLQTMAHARTGDKGRIVTISLTAYCREDFDTMAQAVTTERVSALYGGVIDRPVERYELPQLGALNFVLHRPESMDVSRSLALDAHGKCLGSALLDMEV
jgi:hypothetical protein